MTREYALRGDIGNWRFFAETQLGMTEAEAVVIWNNFHNVGKYLICEAREDNTTRLFIRVVTHGLVDAYKKEGWWNTFTVTKVPVNKGLWLARAVEYRQDRNGYLNLEVQTVLPMDDIKFHKLFSFESTNGTWESVACELMLSYSDAFLDDYKFHSGGNTFNIDALMERFPELSACQGIKDIGNVMLNKFLRDEATMEEIEECLNKLTPWQQLVDDVEKAVLREKAEAIYGEKYPLFAKKVGANLSGSGLSMYLEGKINDYLQRQMEYYDSLVSEGIIEEIYGDYLDKIECGLQYRKKLHDAEKEARKAERKARKKNNK